MTLQVHGAPAASLAQDYGASAPKITPQEGPRIQRSFPPPPPEYLPDMKDTIAITSCTHALSPRIVAVHGPTGTSKSTVFPLAVAHWTYATQGLKLGLTVFAQPRRILAKQLCERVRETRKMHDKDKSVGCVIARESSRDLLHRSSSSFADAVSSEQS